MTTRRGSHDRARARSFGLLLFAAATVPAAAYALHVAHFSKRLVVEVREGAPRRVQEHRQFFVQERRTQFGQRLDQVLKHGAQTPHHLYAVSSVLPNLCDGEVHEVFPVRRAIDKAYASRPVPLTAFGEVTTADITQEVVNLVYRQN